MYKICVIGDQDSVLGFKAVGLSVFPVNSEVEASVVLSKVTQENYAIIYITEYYAKLLDDLIKKFTDKSMPAIIPIASKEGSIGIGLTNLKRSLERAVGADILFNK